MKIGFVLDDSLDGTDGVQQYVLALSNWMRLRGHEVHYLVGETKRRDVPHIHPLSRNIAVRFNGNRMSMPLPSNRRAIQRLVKHERFDVLHVQMPYSPFMAGRVIAAAPKTTTIVGTFHIYPESRPVRAASRLLAWYEYATLCRFAKVWSVSDAAQSFARNTFGLQSQVLPNVVDVARFAAGHPQARLRGSTGPVILFLGRLVPRKGCRTLLEAFAELPEQCQLIICGKGPLEAELRALAAAKGVADRVIFAGFVSEDDKANYLASADTAVFPSSGGESFGIVLLEAMATGRAVVLAAANEGYRTVLAGRPEQLFQPNDSVELANRLRHYIDSPASRRSALDWQAAHVRTFDTAIIGQKLLDAYVSLRPMA